MDTILRLTTTELEGQLTSLSRLGILRSFVMDTSRQRNSLDTTPYRMVMGEVMMDCSSLPHISTRMGRGRRHSRLIVNGLLFHTFIAAHCSLDDGSRDNLVIYVHAHAARVAFEKAGEGLTASGVEFLYPDGSTGSLTPTREVILTAGSVQTPQILELSGIGDPAVLEPLGIAVKYVNPGVGANVQDHPTASSTWSVEAEYYEETLSSFANTTLLARVSKPWSGQDCKYLIPFIRLLNSGSGMARASRRAPSLACIMPPSHLCSRLKRISPKPKG